MVRVFVAEFDHDLYLTPITAARAVRTVALALSKFQASVLVGFDDLPAMT